MRTAIPVILIPCLVVVTLSRTLRAADSPELTPQEVLERCIRTQEHTDQLLAEGESLIEYTNIDGAKSEGKTFYTFSRDGDRLDIEWHDFTRRGDRKVPRLHRITHSDGMKVGYQYSPDRSPLPETGFVHKRDEARERDRMLCCNFQFATTLDGYIFSGGRRLSKYLSEAADLRFIESPKDALIGVQGTTPYGRVKMWLDANHGYLTTRASIRKGPMDFYCLDMRTETLEVAPELKRDGMNGVDVELEQVQSRRIDGIWVPTSGVLTMTERYAGGGETKRKITYKRKKLLLSPPFLPNTFATDLPVGARVVFEDDEDSGKTYVWNGKDVVEKAK